MEQVQVRLENDQGLDLVKNSTGGQWVVVGTTTKDLALRHYHYVVDGEPKEGEELKGAFVSNRLIEGQVGVTGTWCMESLVSSIRRL